VFQDYVTGTMKILQSGQPGIEPRAFDCKRHAVCVRKTSVYLTRSLHANA